MHVRYADALELDILLPVLATAGKRSFPDALLQTMAKAFGVDSLEGYSRKLTGSGFQQAFRAGPAPPIQQADQAAIARQFRDIIAGRTALILPSRAGKPMIAMLERSTVAFLVLHGATWHEPAQRRFAEVAHAIMTAADAHIQASTRPRATGRLPVSTIEERFTSIHPDLSQREREVCARTVSGMTAEAISIDLRISTTTVSTYRRRAYQRIGICSAYELLASLLTDDVAGFAGAVPLRPVVRPAPLAHAGT